MAFSLKALLELLFGHKESPTKNINGSTETKNNISVSAQETPKTCTENANENLVGAGKQMKGKIKFTLTADMTVGDFKKQIEEQLGCIAKIYPDGRDMTPYEDDVLLGSFASRIKGGEAAERYAEKCTEYLESERKQIIDYPEWAARNPEWCTEEALLKRYQDNLDEIVEQLVLEYDDISNIYRFMWGSKNPEGKRLYSYNRLGSAIIFLWKKDEPHCFHPDDTFLVVRKLCGKA